MNLEGGDHGNVQPTVLTKKNTGGCVVNNSGSTLESWWKPLRVSSGGITSEHKPEEPALEPESFFQTPLSRQCVWHPALSQVRPGAHWAPWRRSTFPQGAGLLTVHPASAQVSPLSPASGSVFLMLLPAASSHQPPSAA